LPKSGERDGFDGRRCPIGQTDAPIADVVPAPELETHVLVDSDVLKPCRFVKPNAAEIRQNDLGKRRPEALLP
jgi:hypothetical protein